MHLSGGSYVKVNNSVFHEASYAGYNVDVRLLLSFLVGSLWVVFTTVMAEKKGTTFGGVLGGFPSTAAFSFLFIGLNQSPEIAVDATIVFPLIFAVTNTFYFFSFFF